MAKKAVLVAAIVACRIVPVAVPGRDHAPSNDLGTPDDRGPVRGRVAVRVVTSRDARRTATSLRSVAVVNRSGATIAKLATVAPIRTIVVRLLVQAPATATVIAAVTATVRVTQEATLAATVPWAEVPVATWERTLATPAALEPRGFGRIRAAVQRHRMLIGGKWHDR
uniref:Putative secreted peptide n=1 Tax=Anopheles braziliensis TaxID=58242 RepID=A0A2M3ZRQ1_9DIPT